MGPSFGTALTTWSGIQDELAGHTGAHRIGAAGTTGTPGRPARGLYLSLSLQALPGLSLTPGTSFPERKCLKWMELGG